MLKLLCLHISNHSENIHSWTVLFLHDMSLYLSKQGKRGVDAQGINDTTCE